MTDKKARLNIDGYDQEIELDVLEGTLGPDVIDISSVIKNGYFTFDPGFTSTASCESAITFIDGYEGKLLHRGIPIEQIAEKSDYLNLCHLLYYGHLPDAEREAEFKLSISRHTMLHDQIWNFYRGFRRDAHPMAIMCGVVGALASFYHDALDINSETHRNITAHRLIAKIPTIAAMSYKYTMGQPFVHPRNELGYAENFLNMMFGVPTEDAKVSPVLADAMDRIFMLHADHEQNASTSTVRLAGSSGANPFGCISAGIATLWGPAHGGANEACLKMLQEIGHPDKVDQYVARAKDKNDPYRIMGFGHRVYKNFDPRAKIMKQTCDEVLADLGIEDSPLFQVARRLEEVALNDDYFIKKKLYPNVDFYSGIILKAIGIPPNMFTVIFALSRTIGWISHWNEMVSQPYKIGRPRQLYTGPKERDFPT